MVISVDKSYRQVSAILYLLRSNDYLLTTLETFPQIMFDMTANLSTSMTVGKESCPLFWRMLARPLLYTWLGSHDAPDWT